MKIVAIQVSKIFVIIFILILAITASIILIIKPLFLGYASVSLSIADDTSSENITTTANISKTVNATINSDIILLTTSNATGDISVAEYTSDPERDTGGFAEIGLRYTTITADTTITDVLDWAIIYIYYTDSEVGNAGIEESTLKMYYYNDTLEDWQLETNSRVDTVANFVSANVTHLSTFGIGGNAIPSEEAKGGPGKPILPTPMPIPIPRVKERILLDVSTDIINELKQVVQGKDIIAQIELTKMAGPKADIDIFYSIKDMEDNVITKRKEVVAVETKTIFVVKLNVPVSVKPGDYLFSVKAVCGEEIWVVSSQFKVIEKPTLEIPGQVIITTPVILAGLIIVILIFIFILYYEYIRTKKLTKLIKKVTDKDLRKCKLIKRR